MILLHLYVERAEIGKTLTTETLLDSDSRCYGVNDYRAKRDVNIKTVFHIHFDSLHQQCEYVYMYQILFELFPYRHPGILFQNNLNENIA